MFINATFYRANLVILPNLKGWVSLVHILPAYYRHFYMWLQIHSRYIYRRLTWPDIIDYKLRRLRTRLWHSKIYSNDAAFNFDFELKMEYFMLYISYMILCHSLILDHLLKFTHHHPTPGNAWTVLMRRVVCAPRQYSSWCLPLFRSVPSKRKPFRTLPTCGGQRFGEGTRILHHR